jgi:hypothetical protein
MPPGTVSQASWEIRSSVWTGNPGCVVASGLGPATVTQGTLLGDGTYTYKVQVDGLAVQLPAGRYWLSVAPVTPGPSYLNPTLGANAVGNPLGNDGMAFRNSPGGQHFSLVQSTGAGGTSGDYSLGVLTTSGAVTKPLSCQPAVPISRETAWSANLVSLVKQMTASHSSPYPGITPEDFAAAAAKLTLQLSAIDDAQVRTGIQSLVASIGDPHTNVEWPSSTPSQFLPLSFYWFDDGIYITGAAEQYKELLGAN